MGAGGNDINGAIKNCIASGGFWRDLPVSLDNIRSVTGDLPTTASPNAATAPLPVLTSDVLTLSCAAAASSTFYMIVPLPQELADQTPGVNANMPFQAVRVGLGLYMAGTPTNTPIVTVTGKVVGRTGAVKATYTATYLAPTDGSAPTTAAVGNITTPLEYWWEFTEKLSSSGSYKMTKGDQLHVKFAVATHTTDAMTISWAAARAKLNAADNTIQGSGNSDR